MSALAGTRIVNTRALHQAAALDDLLIARGATSIAFPCIEIAPPDDLGPLAAALGSLVCGAFDWLVFTSANGVFAVAEALGDIRIPTNVQVAAIGDATVEAVRTRLAVDSIVLPQEHSAAGLATSLPIRSGQRVLLPVSAIARPELADSFRANGAIVSEVRAYRTVVGSGGADLPPMLARGEIAGIVFFSPSAVDGFARRLADIGFSPPVYEGLPVACIGQTTAVQARDHGFRWVATASQQTVAALVAALETALPPFRKGVLKCP